MRSVAIFPPIRFWAQLVAPVSPPSHFWPEAGWQLPAVFALCAETVEVMRPDDNGAICATFRTADGKIV